MQPILSMLLANNIACDAKVLWVVDSLFGLVKSTTYGAN